MPASPIRPLGRSGVDVPGFFYGAGSIGGIGSARSTRGLGLTAEEGTAQLDQAYSRGITVVDTADSYAGGDSERVVGRWLPDHGGVLVASKVGERVTAEQAGIDLSAAHIGREIEVSTARLGRVDLYVTHAPDPRTPVQETLEAMTALVESGRIRAFGCSNVSAAELEELLDTASATGLRRPEWVQNLYNLAERRDERDVLPLVLAEGLGYTPFSPLAGGALSDRYLDGAGPAPGSRLAVAGAEYAYAVTPDSLAAVRRLSHLAVELGVSTAGLALAWLRCRLGVTAPIVSPRSVEQWSAVDQAAGTDLEEDTAALVSAFFASAEDSGRPRSTARRSSAGP